MQMTEQNGGHFTRTLARCDTCGSVYVAKISSDRSFSLDGLAEYPCGDTEITLYDSSPGNVGQ